LAYPVVVRSNPMPERERLICSRLKIFRSSSGLSQSEFAKLCGLSLKVYASYEYAYSQLNYGAAWRILTSFPLLNPSWLAGENAALQEIHLIVYDVPQEKGLGGRILFSWYYDHYLKEAILKTRPFFAANLSCPFLVSSDAAGRIAAKEAFGEIIGSWLSRVPDQRLNEFLNTMFLAARNKFAEFRDDSDLEAIAETQRQMMKIAIKHRLVFLGNRGLEAAKFDLTDVSKHGNNEAVKVKLPALLKRLKAATRERGTKSALAKFLGVPLPKISQWLAGTHKPGGETTLQLLGWVEQRERQK